MFRRSKRTFASLRVGTVVVMFSAVFAAGASRAMDATAAQVDQPKDLLRRADAAFADAQALHYYGVYSRSEFEPSADAPEQFTVEAAVWLERQPQDELLGWKVATLSPTAFGPEQPLIRAAFDGQRVSITYPTRRRVLTYEPTLPHVAIVTEFQRAWVLQPFVSLQDSGGTSSTPFSDLVPAGAECELMDARDVNGVPCRGIRIQRPDNDDPTKISSGVTTIWIGDDSFPRRIRSRWTFGGTQYVEHWEYLGLLVASDLADALFQPWIPDDFTHIHFDAEGKPRTVSEPPDEAGEESSNASKPNVAPPPAVAPKVGDPAAELQLTMSDGSTLALESLRGQPVLLDFWGTWCGPCVMALPELQDIHESYKDDGLVVLGVSVRERKQANPQRFLEIRDVTYRTAVRGEDAASAMGVTGYPHVFLIDPEGILRGSWTGYSKEHMTQIRTAIDAMLRRAP